MTRLCNIVSFAIVYVGAIHTENIIYASALIFCALTCLRNAMRPGVRDRNSNDEVAA